MKIANVKTKMESVRSDYAALDHIVSGLVIAYGSGIETEVEKLEDNAMTMKQFEILSERGLLKAIGNLQKNLDALKAAVSAAYKTEV